MKYAVIQTGGKQYRVFEGQELQIEKIEIEAGENSLFEKVLMVSGDEGIVLGHPLTGASVHFTVLDHGRGKKIRIIKFKRRKHHMKRQGHRQWFTRVRIDQIVSPKK